MVGKAVHCPFEKKSVVSRRSKSRIYVCRAQKQRKAFRVHNFLLFVERGISGVTAGLELRKRGKGGGQGQEEHRR